MVKLLEDAGGGNWLVTKLINYYFLKKSIKILIINSKYKKYGEKLLINAVGLISYN